MAPSKSAFKADSYDVVIEGFDKKYTQARFTSKGYTQGAYGTKFNIDGFYCTLDIFLTVCSNGTLGVSIQRSWNKYPSGRFCFGGKVQFVETNTSIAFEASKLCGYETYIQFCNSRCMCGSQCKFGGVNRQINLSLGIGNDIPEKSTIRFELEFLPSDGEPAEALQEDGTSDLKRDMAALRMNTGTADIKLICNGKQFLAHKTILSARSDVFAALFSHKGTKEDKSGEVHIEDCDHEAMEMFLSYLYEDSAPASDTSFEVAKQLMNVANKYNVQSLKNKGSRILLSRLTEDNAVQMALLGKLYNMDTLKKAAKAIIASSEKCLMTMIDESGFRLQDADNNL